MWVSSQTIYSGEVGYLKSANFAKARRTFDGMVLVTLGRRAVAVQSLSCNPMDWSRLGFLVLHQLLEFA